MKVHCRSTYGAKKTTLRLVWHLILVSSCHYSFTTALVEVCRSFQIQLVCRLWSHWSLDCPQSETLPSCCNISHLTPPLPSSEQISQRDLIGLEKNEWKRGEMWWLTLVACEHIPESLLNYRVVQRVEDLCSFESAWVCECLHAHAHGVDSPPPPLHLHRKRKRQPEVISGILFNTLI